MKARRPLRLAVLGLTHDHIWDNLKHLASLREVALVGVADPHAALRDRAAREYGCAAEAEAVALLDQQEPDAVLVFGDNTGGVELGLRAAERGVHVLIEKPMAASLAGADLLLAAARRHKIRLMVNWPVAWWAPLQHAFRLAESGRIGRVWQVKYRAAHNGPREMGCSPYFYDWLYDARRNGAGAFIDYCCYGAALAVRLLGTPSRVTAVTGRLCKEDILVEDNGVLLMQYPGALAIAEASWTQIGHLSSYVTLIYGTQGTLLVEPPPASRLLLATDQHPDGKVVKVPPAPAHQRNALAHFVHCLRTGTPFDPLCEARLGRDAQEVLEAGLMAARRGQEVSLPLKPC